MDLCAGVPVFHASVAQIGKAGPIPCRMVMKKNMAQAIGIKLLDGVGVGETFIKAGEVAFHIRRRLSDEEVAGLDTDWLAIPAVNMAG